VYLLAVSIVVAAAAQAREPQKIKVVAMFFMIHGSFLIN
jgi:hypothetical protein